MTGCDGFNMAAVQHGGDHSDKSQERLTDYLWIWLKCLSICVLLDKNIKVSPWGARLEASSVNKQIAVWLVTMLSLVQIKLSE